MGTLDNLVRQTDVEASLLRPLTDSEQTYLPFLIEQASSLLRVRISDIDARLDLFTAGKTRGIDPQVVTTVLATAIARFLRNPDGSTSVSQAVGPYSTTRSTQGASDSMVGAVTITDSDVAAILPNPLFSPARTIKTRPQQHHRHGWPL